MTTIRTIVWNENEGTALGRYDGCSTRRRAILSCLEEEATVELLTLEHRGGLSSSLASLYRVLSFLRPAPAVDRLLLFYPDFPLFHPPRWFKRPILELIVAAVARFRRASRAIVHVDVVDLPRWQAPALGYRLRMAPAAVRAAEQRIFTAADVISLPTRSFATLLEADLDLSGRDLRVLPNGLPEIVDDLDGEPHAEGSPAYLYAGDLSRRRFRAIDQLVSSFLANAPGQARLHLCGAGGQWLTGYPAAVCHHGHLEEQALLRLAARCDFGLVPYPEGDYFRQCCPAKLGLYLAAGLPVLTSRLDETVALVNELEVGHVRPFADYGTFFRDGAQLLAAADRLVVRERCRRYGWAQRLQRVFFESS